MKMESIAERRKLRRKVQGIAAALLPFEADGRIAVEAFQKHLQATQRAGLMNAVNMDTGYVNYLNEAGKLEVLRWTREALGKDAPFVGGAYIEGQDGDVGALYRKQMDAIVAHGGIPILFQTSRLHGKSSAEKAAAYAAVCRGYAHVLADALQYLGNVAFREPVPAYKHSAAVFLHLAGRIPSDLTHPKNPKRPAWEAEILRDCARRLD